jgi:hypothetical protein
VSAVLVLDHVFRFVADPAAAARVLEDDGWVLDGGQRHAGQGTRNRRLRWPERFFELLWIQDEAEARANALRLDRRAAWATTGASPVGIAFRGRPSDAELGAFWPYDALGFRIWIHRDNEDRPERPLVFALELDRVPGPEAAFAQRRPGTLREVRVSGPSAPALPAFAGPPVVHEPGPHRLELVVDPAGAVLEVEPGLGIQA